MNDLSSAYGITEFLMSYGLFAAKTITLIVLGVLGLIVFASIISYKQKSSESIEIEKINDHYDAMQDALESEIFSKEEYKQLLKAKKKQEKQERKAQKKKAKLKAKEQSKNKNKCGFGNSKTNENCNSDSNTNTSDNSSCRNNSNSCYSTPGVCKTKSPCSADGQENCNNEVCSDETDDNEDDANKRSFVLSFCGDMHASEVDNLREEITALLLVLQDGDEVMVILESYGGIVHSYGLAASQLQRLRQRDNIQLTVAVDLVAASGGYMMACVAHKIIAAPFAIVGSIGVIAQVPNFNRLLTKHDVDIELHTAGEYKRTLTMLGKNTAKARDKFCEELDDTHTLFKEFVSSNRPQVNIETIATGEHWYGTQALALNLIDEIKTSDDYLLEKAKNDVDIFEVNYQFNESIKEKMQNLLYDSVGKLFDKMWYRLSHLSRWQ